MNRLLTMLIPTVVLFTRGAVAGVDLSQSTVSSDRETVPAGTVVTVDVVLKNSGETASEGTDVRVRFPHNGFLVRIDELPELKRDDNDREVTAVVNIPAGGEYRFSYDLLALAVRFASRATAGKGTAVSIGTDGTFPVGRSQAAGNPADVEWHEHRSAADLHRGNGGSQRADDHAGHGSLYG